MTPEQGDGGLPGPPGPSLIPMTGLLGGSSLNRLVQNILALRPRRPLCSLSLVEKQGARLASPTPGHTPHGSWRSPPARVLAWGNPSKAAAQVFVFPGPSQPCSCTQHIATRGLWQPDRAGRPSQHRRSLSRALEESFHL